MAMKLYVGNLPPQTSSEDLRDLFAQAGTVESASVVEDRDTGRSRGFGFVEMATKEEGEAAIAQFNSGLPPPKRGVRLRGTTRERFEIIPLDEERARPSLPHHESEMSELIQAQLAEVDEVVARMRRDHLEVERMGAETRSMISVLKRAVAV
jgi:RNA recognition motif-containing protein